MIKLRIVGVSGSPRHGNTDIMVKKALEAAKKIESEDVEVETVFVSLAGKNIKGCTNCRACIKAGHCVLKDDWEETFRPLFDPMPDGVILGSPVYFFSVTSQMRAFLERTTSLLKANFNFAGATRPAPDWSHTVGAALSIGYDRNGGQEHAIECMNSWFIVNDFLVTGAKHIGYIGAPGWQCGTAEKDSVLNDELGLRSCEIIGERVSGAALIIKRGLMAEEASDKGREVN